MKVDLAQGTQLVYMVPDMMMSINDFHDHIRISIQTHGYEAWQGGEREENLLGEQVKLMWQQWRTAYPEVYEILIGMADDPQNITSHMRTVIMMEDPYRGSTERQDITQRDLDRLTYDELPYPKFKKDVERILANEVAYPTADEASSSGIYNPPIDSMMGPPLYPL
ncbi:hypothetical protein Tco_1111135 [Tanacetum coccineum]|uniref:Uncharacterized protein n=1 Tax=Tanacetum coccineum TaxID=301880 RepID=A0ABQ5IN32_9ASTR